MRQGAATHVALGTTVSGRHFALSIGGRISGTLSSTSGAPIAGQTVTVYGRDAFGNSDWVTNATTNASGAYMASAMHGCLPNR